MDDHVVPAPGGRATPPAAALPYGPRATALLEPLRRAFLLLNRWLAAPAIRSGLGPLLATPTAGSILVLRTTGRRSGRIREAPLGYAIVDGKIVVVAGYGRAAHWYRNALARPEVEVVLPGAVLAGRAAEIVDPAERRAAFRQVIAAMGVVGRLTVGDVAQAGDARIDELVAVLPLLAITPTAIRPGPYDPGGTFWRIPFAATVAIGVTALARRLLRRRA